MGIRLFVGNLPFTTTEAELKDKFSEFGSVKSARIITDKETGRPRGFGFVEYDSREEGDAAIQALDGQLLSGRAIVVNEAKPQERRGGGGFGGGRDGGGGFGGGGGRDGGGYGGGGRDGGGYGGGGGGRGGRDSGGYGGGRDGGGYGGGRDSGYDDGGYRGGRSGGRGGRGH